MGLDIKRSSPFPLETSTCTLAKWSSSPPVFQILSIVTCGYFLGISSKTDSRTVT